MSNNKQTMKLYTEEQVRKAIELARDTHPEGRVYMQREEYDYSMDEIFDKLTPTELPSDEEIEEYADSVMPYAEKIGGETYTAYRAIKLGAKWVCKIIQGGNK